MPLSAGWPCINSSVQVFCVECGDVNRATRYEIRAKALGGKAKAKAKDCKAKTKNFGLRAKAKAEAITSLTGAVVCKLK